jgi:HSP20 family molecular chaperone IbpA
VTAAHNRGILTVTIALKQPETSERHIKVSH